MSALEAGVHPIHEFVLGRRQDARPPGRPPKNILSEFKDEPKNCRRQLVVRYLMKGLT
jgi:hypothetical protein